MSFIEYTFVKLGVKPLLAFLVTMVALYFSQLRKYEATLKDIGSLRLSAETLRYFYSVNSQVSVISKYFCMTVIPDPLCVITGKISEEIVSKRRSKLNEFRTCGSASPSYPQIHFAVAAVEQLRYLETSLNLSFTDLGEQILTTEFQAMCVSPSVEEIDKRMNVLLPSVNHGTVNISTVERNSRFLFSYLTNIQKVKSYNGLYGQLFRDWCEKDDSKLQLLLLNLDELRTSGGYENLEAAARIAGSLAKLDGFLPVGSLSTFSSMNEPLLLSVKESKSKIIRSVTRLLKKKDFSSIYVMLDATPHLQLKRELQEIVSERFMESKVNFFAAFSALLKESIPVGEIQYLMSDLSCWMNGTSVLGHHLDKDSRVDESFINLLVKPLVENEICFSPGDKKLLSMSFDRLKKWCDPIHFMLLRITGSEFTDLFQSLLALLKKNQMLLENNLALVFKKEFYQGRIQAVMKTPFLDFDFNCEENIAHLSPASFAETAVIYLEKLLSAIKEVSTISHPEYGSAVRVISITSNSLEEGGGRSVLYMDEQPEKWILRYSKGSNDSILFSNSVYNRALLNHETVISSNFEGLSIPGSSLPLVGNCYTILFWLFVPGHDSNWRGILKWGSADLRIPGLWIHPENSNFHFSTTVDGKLQGQNCDSIPLQTWNHVGLQRDHNDFNVFLNGRRLCGFSLNGFVFHDQEQPFVIPPDPSSFGTNLKLDKVVFSNQPLPYQAFTAFYRKGRSFTLVHK
jgi:hypothetical protein